MKKMTLITISFLACLYLADRGSPDRGQQDIVQPLRY